MLFNSIHSFCIFGALSMSIKALTSSLKAKQIPPQNLSKPFLSPSPHSAKNANPMGPNLTGPQYGGGGGGYWEAQTHSTTVAYGQPQSPQRIPSPPPPQHMPYGKTYHNNNNAYGHGGYNKYQTNGMGAVTTYGHEAHNNYQTNGTQALANHGHEGIFGDLTPSSFPSGTDPKVMAFFQNADRDGNGFIDEKVLKQALSSYSSTFSLRTIRLLMVAFTKTNTKAIGPKEFLSVYYGLQQWKAMFQRFDRNRNGKIDPSELREALRNLGYPVSETVLGMLIATFDKNGGHMAIGFDGFIECCLTVKGLSDKFKEKDQMLNGTATFTYENFMMTVLPYIVA